VGDRASLTEGDHVVARMQVGTLRGMDSLILIRHGDTEWSRARRHTGRTDLPLLPDGEQQAAALREPLTAYRFDAVLVSPLQRAARTAQLAGLEAAETEPDLLEWDYGEVEGLTTPEVRESRPGWTVWHDGAPGGESPADVGARADRVLDRASAYGGQVCLVAHGHVLRVLTARWLGLEPSAGELFRLETARISLLGYEHDRPVLLRWNAGH
jgi:broad specificity phosphatase PhoE